MLNGVSYGSPYSAYGGLYAGRAAQGAERAQTAQRSAVLLAPHKAAQPETPVQPVTPVRGISGGEDPAQAGLLRFASDPAEMAVRMRIQYPGDSGAQANAVQQEQAQAPALTQSKSAQEVMEEGECQTCKERKYQDGSDDPGVSFKTASHIDPELAAAKVRGHEMEHVVREQAKAEREGRKVISQSVTMHTAICPECGKAYVSGGTTRTTTAESPGAGMPVPEQDNNSN